MKKLSLLIVIAVLFFARGAAVHAIDSDFNIFNYDYQYPFTAGAFGNSGGYSSSMMYCYTPGETQCHLNWKTYRVCQQNKRWSSWRVFSPQQEASITQNCARK